MGSGYRFAAGKIGASSPAADAMSMTSCDRGSVMPCSCGIVGKDGKPMMEPPHPLLAHGKVRHVGDPVAMVIADSAEAARNAAERIAVDYRVLPAVTGAVAAMAPG